MIPFSVLALAEIDAASRKSNTKFMNTVMNTSGKN